ncbi:MAG: hypothetical protein C0404_14380, partial [Verrucomicrobia bacterium]|nr:hypothetical protein [Verrucomicrobiota bacterium]
MRNAVALACGLASAMSLVTVLAVEPVAKPVAVSDGERIKLMAAETPEQKQLRVELADLAKKGGKIYFGSNMDGAGRIYGIGPDGSGLECMTPTMEASQAHASADGKKLVFDTSAKSFSKEEIEKLPVDPVLKRNSASVVLGVLDIGTKKIVPVAFGDNGQWHPDGKKICYNTEGAKRKIGIVDLENKVEKIIGSPEVPANCMFPKFSPDGKWLLIGGYPFTLVEL